MTVPLSLGQGAFSALVVFVEPVVEDARVVVLGDANLVLGALAAQLLDLGARTIHVFDPEPSRALAAAADAPRGVVVRPLQGELDVRDGAFDLAVVPDAGALPDPEGALGGLRRVVDPRGVVIAMARARMADVSAEGSLPELAPAAFEYAELYDLFALQFDNVTMTGVLPFRGVVFAELGVDAEDEEEVGVSVDTRLVTPPSPGVFVVAASRDPQELERYAIVQVPGVDAAAFPHPGLSAVDPDFAAMQLKSELLAAQLEEQRARVTAADARGMESSHRFERLAGERDAALARALELEAVLAGTQQSLAVLEVRLLGAEQIVLERDDQIAALSEAIAEQAAQRPTPERFVVETPNPELVAQLLTRAERAEAAVALNVADLAQVAEAHAMETAALEEQLRERARVIGALDKELARREQLVRELVAQLHEPAEGEVNGTSGWFEAAPPLPAPEAGETARLKKKLDDLALEVARREGELVSRGWRIAELEAERTREGGAPAAAAAPIEKARDRARELEGELSRTQEELDALRQALTQEHTARVAAETGEELLRARAELAQQAALLEQMRARVEGYGSGQG